MAKQDITWERLIRESESQIAAYRKKIDDLRKSIIFFRKQAETGAKFPVSGKVDTQNTS
jgi:hypothetical protein